MHFFFTLSFSHPHKRRFRSHLSGLILLVMYLDFYVDFMCSDHFFPSIHPYDD